MTTATKTDTTPGQTLAYSDRKATEIEDFLAARPGHIPEPAYNAWDGALCAETDPELFFPEKGESPTQGKRICHKCPLMATCLEYALDNGEKFGVWGGRSPAERRSIASIRTGTPEELHADPARATLLNEAA